jgi:hypothetical protein
MRWVEFVEVPVISKFFGIIITMNYREHGPPHSDNVIADMSRLHDAVVHMRYSRGSMFMSGCLA